MENVEEALLLSERRGMDSEEETVGKFNPCSFIAGQVDGLGMRKIGVLFNLIYLVLGIVRDGQQRRTIDRQPVKVIVEGLRRTEGYVQNDDCAKADKNAHEDTPLPFRRIRIVHTIIQWIFFLYWLVLG